MVYVMTGTGQAPWFAIVTDNDGTVFITMLFILTNGNFYGKLESYL